jgi:hypothetical protein
MQILTPTPIVVVKLKAVDTTGACSAPTRFAIPTLLLNGAPLSAQSPLHHEKYPNIQMPNAAYKLVLLDGQNTPFITRTSVTATTTLRQSMLLTVGSGVGS